MSSAGCGRVLHFLGWAARSGAERAALNLCKATRELEPAVWFPRDGPMVEEFVRAGFARLTTKDVLEDPVATRARFSLLHIHCGGYEPTVYRVARRLGMPVLTTLHSTGPMPELDGPLVCVAPEVVAVQDPANRVRLILNAVDTDEFVPGPPSTRERMVLMRVCRPERCAPYFLEAMRRVLIRHPGAELWLVGEAGISDSTIRFLGSRGDVPDLLRQADIFVYAPMPEGGAHDMCVLEAMSAGAPPVVTDVASVRDSVTHMYDGIVVPFGDADAFAAAVERLIVEPELRSSLARNARRTAEQRFGLPRLAADYMRAYADTLESLPSAGDIVRRNVRAFVIERTRIARFEKNLALLYDTLAATPIAGRYWMIGGLLIGWARDGRVLPHDSHDADFAIFQNDVPAFREAFSALRAAGFEPLSRYIDNRGIIVEYAFKKDNTRFDFFLPERVGEFIHCTYFGRAPRLDYILPIQLNSKVPYYDLAPMEFVGRTWLKPADHEGFLTAEYGDWRTPSPAFDHRSDSPSVTEISWWNNADNGRFDF